MSTLGKYASIILPLSLFLSGCTAPASTLQLITVARKAISGAREGQIAQHDEIVRNLHAQANALDHAFDNDVRLVAAGQIKDAQGKSLTLTGEWVISARKGYTAARGLIAEQVRSAEAAHAKRLDNLKAADESLEMASELVIRQLNVTERIRQHLLSVQQAIVKTDDRK